MYPSARRLDLTENLHGHLVRDPYRWLEDPASGEGQAWLAAQDGLVRGRAADQEHSVLMTVAPGEPERALIDPMALDPSGATTLDHWAPDNEGRLLAYQLSAGGGGGGGGGGA